jgi:hypothetical protein
MDKKLEIEVNDTELGEQTGDDIEETVDNYQAETGQSSDMLGI